MEQLYEGAESLFVRAYDAFYAGGAPPIAGDIAFYDRLAQAAGGPVLELGCGTGRIALALAQAGLSVTGVDVSAGMLALARRKSERLAAASRCLTFVEADMARLDLGRRFGMAFIAFRSFQHLLTVDEQRATLTGVRRHLRPDGRLALHLFDPRFDLLADENPPTIRQSGIDPATQRRYAGEILRTGRDCLNQIRRDLWRYTETDLNGALLKRRIGRWRCAGPTDGSYAICSNCAASWSKRNTAISTVRRPHMARSWSSSRGGRQISENEHREPASAHHRPPRGRLDRRLRQVG